MASPLLRSQSLTAGPPPGATPAPGEELPRRPGVDDAALLDTCAAGRCHAELDRREVIQQVRIGVDGDQDAQVPGAPRMHVVQVQYSP
jgi:hypothetical protein